jgi:hypothetical protein
MENVKTVQARDQRSAGIAGKKSRPYRKPSFQFEKVFETQALSCGKVHSHTTGCKLNPKNS